MKRSHYILWIPCVVYYLFITLMSAVPGTEWSGLVQTPFPYFDKIVHFVLYSFLGMVLARALSWESYYRHIKKRWYLYFAIILPFAGMFDELHQYFVPERSMDFFDWLADMSGAVCGGLFYSTILLKLGKKNKKIADLEENDVRGFGLILAMTYFAVLISLNIFNYKQGVLKNYQHLALALIFVEYGLLGLLTIRFFYLRRDRKFLLRRDWFFDVLAGVIFILVHQLSLSLLHIKMMPMRDILWALFCYILGALFYYIDKQIEKFRKKVWENNLYRRKTWQRVYFFLPPFIVMLVITFLSTQTPTVLYQNQIPMPSEHIPDHGPISVFRNYFFLHGLQFFTFGLFYFRAVAWECWWHIRSRRIYIWAASYFFLIVYAVMDELLQNFVPGRQADPYDSLTDLMGGTVALLIYMFGYRLVKEKFFAVKLQSGMTDIKKGTMKHADFPV